MLGARKSLTLYEGMQGMLENTFMNIKNRSSKITAELVIPAARQWRHPVAGRALRRLVALHEGRQAGLRLQLPRAGAVHDYRAAGAAGRSGDVTLDFVYDGGGAGKGGKATLLVNGKPVAEGRVEKTQPNIFSADETADVGIDNQTPVALGIGIGAETRFTGKINKVTLEVGPVK